MYHCNQMTMAYCVKEIVPKIQQKVFHCLAVYGASVEDENHERYSRNGRDKHGEKNRYTGEAFYLSRKYETTVKSLYCELVYWNNQHD